MAEPPPAPVPCGTCRNPITLTETGWTHLTAHGVPETGWLCPMPHMHLAAPNPPPRTPQPRHVIPPLTKPDRPAPDQPAPGSRSLQPGHMPTWEGK